MLLDNRLLSIFYEIETKSNGFYLSIRQARSEQILSTFQRKRRSCVHRWRPHEHVKCENDLKDRKNMFEIIKATIVKKVALLSRAYVIS